MKFALVAALVAVLAIGSESASLMKREIPEEFQKMSQYFQGLVDALKSIESAELANMAKTNVEEMKAQFQPMVDKLQEQLKPLSNIDEQIKPLAASLQAQIAPYTDLVQTQVEDVLRYMVDQTKAILPAQ
ncbi:type-4 ice-structuring protein-like [Hoplias malabaricus]|uniref:type-4 ice-structuring protein-like n=1 Tax=Hoplias malabaricus TaxID=27720 RepID=UPI003461C161